MAHTLFVPAFSHQVVVAGLSWVFFPWIHDFPEVILTSFSKATDMNHGLTVYLCALWLLPWLQTSVQGDTEVFCVFLESCILSCSFQGGKDAVVHWHLIPGETVVHSYYHNQDQLARQDHRFRGRTSLFKDQVSRGNASLQLTGVEVQDQGRYKCFTSTIRGNDESFINLKVDASISGSNTAATIPCNATQTSVTNFSLTWRFNHSQIILTQTRGDVLYTVSERWAQQVKNVSESGSLMLQDLSSHHEGTYTCELSDAEETLITNTLFRIQEELTVTCKPPEVCVLPCHFQSDHSGARVMWIKTETGAVVTCSRFGNTSFVKRRTGAADEYKGRTGLNEDQVLRGNATLLLRIIKPSDEGRYNCFVHTASGTVLSGIINLVMENRITCSSQGIYPEPQLTWSTSPPSNMRRLHSTTIIQQTAQLLYNISSNIILPDGDADLSYSCSINTGTSRRKATLFKPTSITGSRTETTIPCTASNTPEQALSGNSTTFKSS
ncbi:hypothetical protein INR49_026222 [Caranx melampygus]|nr:hypothetical protein INR49_026222 [Caranx melampygus]